VASAAVAVQARVNGEFGQLLGDAVQAAWLGFLAGLVALLLVVAGRSRQRAATVRLRDSLSAGLPAWQTLGGVAGATMIISQAAAVPVLGVALFTVLLVGGQTSMGLAVDRWGLAPGGRRAITRRRLLGVVLMVGGVALAASDRLLGGGVAWWWLPAIAAVGAGLPFQQAYNARVAGAAGSPIVAAAVNFTVGSTALTAAVLLRWALAGIAPAVLPSPLEHPAVWTAGLLGVFFVFSAAIAVPRLGVLVFGLITVAGQLLASLTIDVYSGQVVVTPALAAGVLLCVVAVVTGSGRGMGQSVAWQR
jgi:transporter family-2 protein